MKKINLKKIRNPFLDLSRFEWMLWLLGVATVILSFFLSPSRDYWTPAASLIGVTALIFVAKGYVIGQLLTVVFAIFYGVISFRFRYYGEMITYLGMTSPIAILTVISWLRHPYRDTAEVEVNRMTRRGVAVMWVLAFLVTVCFYPILKFLGTANLMASTVSVMTSFLASYLTLMRSPYYALAYAANDVILIVLWTLAMLAQPSYFPMIVCFVMFLANDLYGFYHWQRMKRRQNGSS